MASRWRKVSCVDDLDLCEAIMDIERHFGVGFAHDAFSNCWSVGAAFDVVWSGLPASLTSGGKCPSQMTFYRLRAAIGNRDLKPETPLREIQGFRYVVLQRTLREQGWRMPMRICAMQTWLLSWLVAGLAFAALFSLLGSSAALVALVLLVASVQILHRTIFTSTGTAALTLGELARDVMEPNTGKLLSNGASFSRRMVFDRFMRALGDDIGRESGFC